MSGVSGSYRYTGEEQISDYHGNLLLVSFFGDYLVTKEADGLLWSPKEGVYMMNVDGWMD